MHRDHFVLPRTHYLPNVIYHTKVRHKALWVSKPCVRCSSQYGWTPLVHAVRDDQPLMARLLLKAGADRKARDNVGASTAGHVS